MPTLKEISSHGAAVVIQDDREPGLLRFAIRADEQNIEWRMIGLPNGIRAGRFAPVNQVECFAVGLRALVGQGQEISWQPADDAIYIPINEPDTPVPASNRAEGNPRGMEPQPPPLCRRAEG
jgi:hypothetical protein